MNIMEKIRECGVIPVVVLSKAEDAVPTARALLAGGVGAMEITFRTEAAAESIARVAAECPEMIVGAGTVLNTEQCEAAIRKGARFIVSPGLSESVVRTAQASQVPVIPGCVTPTEIMKAMEMGLSTLKFFPAGVYGGLSALKALSAPFGGISFMPTGGVSAENLAQFMAAPFICAVGGSWLCSKKDIEAHQFDKITQLCREARDIVDQVRQ